MTSPDSSSDSSGQQRTAGPFCVLRGLVIALVAWLVATVADVAWQFSSGGLTAPAGILDALSRYWLVDFAVGGILLVAYCAWLAARKQIDGAGLLAAAGAYFLPVSVTLLAAGVILAIFPAAGVDRSIREYAPVLALLGYAAGVILATALVRSRRNDFMTGFALPPAVLAIIGIGAITISTFASDDFRYRDAFEFRVDDVSLSGGHLTARCRLKIHKPGEYRYNVWLPVIAGLNEATGEGKILWEGKGEAPVSEGDYSMTVTWQRVSREVLSQDGGLEEGSASFMVSREDSGTTRPLRQFTIPTWTALRTGL